MPHASFKKKFRSFLDIREAREFYDSSESEESLSLGLTSPLGSPDHDEVPDMKSSSADTSTLRRAFTRTFSWKKRKSQSPTSIEKMLTEGDKSTAAYDEACTIFIIGYSGTGKTAAVVRFLTGRYIHEYKSSHEESYNRSVNIDGKNISLNLTSMSQKIKDHDNELIKPCTGIMLAYSIVDIFSYHYVESLLDELKSEKITTTPIVLVGTKSDLANRRCICKKTAEALAEENGCYYYEFSAATNEGVADCFENLIKASLNVDRDISDGSFGSKFDFTQIGRRRSSLS